MTLRRAQVLKEFTGLRLRSPITQVSLSYTKDRENQDPKQPDLCSSAQVLTPPKTAVEGIHLGGRNSQSSSDFRERSSTADDSTPKINKFVCKGDAFSLHSSWWWEIYVLDEEGNESLDSGDLLSKGL